VSFALPAVLLLLLALPGFIFVYAYRGQLRPKNDALVSNASMTLGWVLGLLGAIVAHAAWVPLANEVLRGSSGLKIDMDSVAYLLAGEYRDHFEEHSRSFTEHADAVLLYFLSLYAAAALLGAISHSLVRRTGLDRKFALLRFNNQWHYLFAEGPNVSAVLVTVSCNHQDHSCLYAGMLHSYDFTSEGELQRIVLTSAARAELPAAPAAVAKFVAIQGDLFVVWCRDVNTLNIDYLHPAPPATHTHSVPPHHGSGRHGATP
jgi:hypothetical protein